MKKKNCLLLVVFLTLLAIPFVANAEQKVTIYFFRGDGCPHCADAEEFFKTIEEDEEYKGKFEIKDYEVWYDQDNERLAEKVAKAMGETLGGVPYIVIGEKTWNGYTDSYGEEIKEEITRLYAQDGYNDPVKEVLEGKSNSGITITIIVIVIVGVGLALHFARKDTEEIPYAQEKEEKKEEVQETKKEEVKKESPSNKNNTNKTTNNSNKKSSKKKTKKR